MRFRLSYANVMSTLAVVIALGGTSYAAVAITGRQVRNGSLSGVDIRGDSLTGAQVRESTLGRVPRAAFADRAGRAASAAAADTAAAAATLGGRGPEAFQAAGAAAGGALAGTYPNPTLAPPKVRFLGAAPVLTENGWSASNSPGFWKDGAGVVHLQGTVSINSGPASSAVIFTLPSGFRPPNIGSRFFAVPPNTIANAQGFEVSVLEISGTGQVRPTADTTEVALDGVSFIAG
ncbi:MAG: hypothetical protein U0R70_14825 [Solirubrobacteraceae bacterium]